MFAIANDIMNTIIIVRTITITKTTIFITLLTRRII